MSWKRLTVALAGLALALPAPALAKGEFDPSDEFELHDWIPIHIGGLDLSINKAVAYLWLGALLTILLGVVLMRVRARPRPRPPPDARRDDLRHRADAGRGAGPAVEGDRALVPVRRLADAVHLGRQHDRLHPAAALGRDVPHRRRRASGLRHLRRDRVALGHARPRADDLRLHARRGHPLERLRPLLQELDPGRAAGRADPDRAARDPRPVHAPDQPLASGSSPTCSPATC